MARRRISCFQPRANHDDVRDNAYLFHLLLALGLSALIRSAPT